MSRAFFSPRFRRFFGCLGPFLTMLAANARAAAGPPPLQKPSEAGLRVATFNIRHGADALGIPNLRAVARRIREIDPDLAALQEVDRRWGPRSLWRDQAAWLAGALGMHHVFAATLDRRPRSLGRGEYGIAVLSRLPILSAGFLPLPGDLERRGVLLVWIDAGGESFPVACTHLGLSTADRRRQIAALLSWLPGHAALILLGDFNTRAETPEIKMIPRDLADIQAACGRSREGTYFHRGRPVRIDYIFAGPAWRAVDCRPVPGGISDHHPVVADLLHRKTSPGREGQVLSTIQS